MTEAEVWQQIEQYAIEGNWTGVGVLGDWLQEQGIAEGETVCWWATEASQTKWLTQLHSGSVLYRVGEEVVTQINRPLPEVIRTLHKHRQALLT